MEEREVTEDPEHKGAGELVRGSLRADERGGKQNYIGQKQYEPEQRLRSGPVESEPQSQELLDPEPHPMDRVVLDELRGFLHQHIIGSRLTQAPYSHGQFRRSALCADASDSLAMGAGTRADVQILTAPRVQRDEPVEHKPVAYRPGYHQQEDNQ